MDKTTLNAEDKTRLAQVVDAYLNPPRNTFRINGIGEVILIERSILDRLLNRDTEVKYDFLTVVQMVIDKIMNDKGSIPYVMQLCGDSFGELLETNDRSTVIKRLYLAHLVDEQPKSTINNNARPSQHRIEISEKKTERIIPTGFGEVIKFQKVNPSYKLACDVAEVMNAVVNNGGKILTVENID